MSQLGGYSMVTRTIDIITIVIALLPIGIKVFQLLTAKTHSQRIKTISQRSQIIVEALSEAGYSSEYKKQVAMGKLATYAKEVNIKVSEDQLEDYIESAYLLLVRLTK